MGTFASSFYSRGAHMPEEKVHEFQDRLEKLFQAGGMMEIERISMFGVEAVTLRKAQMHEKGMDFCYNYFEEAFWEDAGYNRKKNRIWSDKIGWREFNWTMIAAYVLENLYTDGTGAVFDNGNLVDESISTGWINYLFHENFHAKNRNPWKLFDAITTETDEDDYKRNINWERFAFNIEGLFGYTEICAVQNGINKMMRWLTDSMEKAGAPVRDDDPAISYYNIMRLIIQTIRTYRTEHDLPVDEKFQVLCDHLKEYYQNPEVLYPGSAQGYDEDNTEHALFLCLYMINLPVITIKTISEVYKQDFWELWEEFRNVVYGTQRVFMMQPEESAEKPISTAGYFGRCADDMIYFWREDGDILFSDELRNWFLTLKKRYEEIMKESFTVENPVKWILELMDYAQEEYYHIFTFSEFFEESIAHQSERNYIALWKIYEELLHDPEMEEAGKVIFVPDGPDHEKEGLHYISGREPRRRLLMDWCIIKREKRENIARVTLRRYMALVANADLRKKVFGF